MTLKECYDALGGNYEDTVRRLYNEKLVEKFLFKFEEDPSFENLKKALEEENLEAAFRAAHTLKGVAQNMGFDNLAESSSVLTEALRSRNVMPCAEQVEEVCEDYNKIREAITEYKKQDEC